jgi:hypothetical protein
MATFEAQHTDGVEHTKSNMPADLVAARAELERLLTENKWLEPDRGDLSKYESHVWRSGEQNKAPNTFIAPQTFVLIAAMQVQDHCLCTCNVACSVEALQCMPEHMHVPHCPASSFSACMSKISAAECSAEHSSNL